MLIGYLLIDELIHSRKNKEKTEDYEFKKKKKNHRKLVVCFH